MSGPQVTDFSISKPDGWPAGKYKVEVSLTATWSRAAISK